MQIKILPDDIMGLVEAHVKKAMKTMVPSKVEVDPSDNSLVVSLTQAEPKAPKASGSSTGKRGPGRPKKTAEPALENKSEPTTGEATPAAATSTNTVKEVAKETATTAEAETVQAPETVTKAPTAEDVAQETAAKAAAAEKIKAEETKAAPAQSLFGNMSTPNNA